MPIPFILGGAALLMGGYGIKKGLDANEDMNKAKKVNRDAQNMANTAEHKIKRYKSDTKKALENLGKTKISILSSSLSDFVDQYSKIKNININDSVGLEELRGFNPDSKDFIEMKDMSFRASELASGGVGSVAAGALAGFGASSAVTAFGAASTGTAIAGLSGAAATNATLAWLGGGALSAGGFGVAGGMAVLGGIVAGPALAVGGAFMASKAEKALNDARSNYDNARKFSQEAENICTALYAIEKRANQIRDLLEKLNDYLIPAVSKLETVIETCGTDWREYGSEEKSAIMKAASLAKTTKIVLDTSILREDGSLDPSSQDKLDTGLKFLNQMS